VNDPKPPERDLLKLRMILQQLYESLTDHAGRTEYSYAQFSSHTVLFFKLAISGLKFWHRCNHGKRDTGTAGAPPANVGQHELFSQQIPFTLRWGEGARGPTRWFCIFGSLISLMNRLYHRAGFLLQHPSAAAMRLTPSVSTGKSAQNETRKNPSPSLPKALPGRSRLHLPELLRQLP